ncbi:MAG: N-acetylmuramoyl-L-alanine amidase [Bacteroidales bacterium]|nr:N-acetylmuramoyl-L-alanine amidase [Candidatus Physcousia equi]
MKTKRSISFLIVLFFSFMLVARGKQDVWVIDAGHGGYDVGCEGSRAKEKDITLRVARRVAELVRQNVKGVKVVMTREGDRFVSLEQRANIANNAGAALFLSIHVNAVPDNSKVRGTETYYGPIGATSVPTLEKARKKNIQRSELLAWEMQKHYGLAGRPISRGVKRERYYVILHTLMPSVLTEIGFISTPSEQDYMISAKGQEEIAQSIYHGLLEYHQIVKGGTEKRMLAEMRRTGGRAKALQPYATTQKEQQLLSASGEASKPKQTECTETSAKQSKTTLAANKNTGEAATPDVAVTASPSYADSVAEASVVLDPSLEPVYENEELSFAIQVFALKTRIKTSDARLKGLKGLRVLEADGKYKYLCGTTSDYQEARQKLSDVRKHFPDAFLVAFLGSRQISTADAQEMVVKK